MPLSRYAALILACIGCRSTTTVDATSACRTALDRGLGFYVTPFSVAILPGSVLQLQANGPPECLPATFYITAADTAVLSISATGAVTAKQLGHAYARARATDPTVEGATEISVLNIQVLGTSP